MYCSGNWIAKTVHVNNQLGAKATDADVWLDKDYGYTTHLFICILSQQTKYRAVFWGDEFMQIYVQHEASRLKNAYPNMIWISFHFLPTL